jgi:hypothetical protein
VDRAVVLLGIRSAFKENLQASVAELVYGEPLRISSELLTLTAEPMDPAHLITTPPALGPPQTSSGSTPRLPGYIRAQRPQELQPCLSPPGHNALGFGAPLQRPLPGPVTEREDTATPRAWEVHRCVSQQGQAGLHPQDRSREQLQPASSNNPGCRTTSHAATALHKNYMLRSPHPFLCSLKHLSSHLRGGVMWEPPTVQNRQLPPVAEQAIFICYSLQSGRRDTHTSATQPARS